jgi:hypothetical protein
MDLEANDHSGRLPVLDISTARADASRLDARNVE